MEGGGDKNENSVSMSDQFRFAYIFDYNSSIDYINVLYLN